VTNSHFFMTINHSASSPPMPSTGAVVKPLPSRTWGVSLGAFLPLATAHRLHNGTLQKGIKSKDKLRKRVTDCNAST